METTAAIQIDLGYIGHRANEMKHIEQLTSNEGYFAKFRDYTDLFGNQGTELITTAPEDTIKNYLK